MHIVGIVAEYNPFHTGHGHQLARTRALLGEDAPAVAVMSGNWVQQAHPAIADKWLRTKLALAGGVDLVLELPTLWAVSSAEPFARGAVSLLHVAGVVDTLSFGSECGEIAPLAQLAACLNSPEYDKAVSALLGDGTSFASTRQAAAQQLLGETGRLLSTPNNNLGVEYMRALNSLDSPIVPVTVPRTGAGHHSGEPMEFASATYLRGQLAQGNWAAARPYLSPSALNALTGGDFPSLERVERAMLARVRTMTADQWAALPDSGGAEGLTVRLERAGQRCGCMEEFFVLAKTKRYPHARLRRLALWAFLGLTAADLPAAPPYLRVLGFNGRGRGVLRQMKDRATLPILTKPTHARALDETGRRLFELEARCTDLYGLCFETPRPAGLEWTTGPIIFET